MKCRIALSLALIVFVLSTYFTAAMYKPQESAKQRPYTIYAATYPLYCITEQLTQNIPGIEVHQLFQPVMFDMGEYQISDWDNALINSSDVLIFDDTCSELFADVYNSSDVIVINLGNILKPWAYLTPAGLKEYAEAICAYMVTIDEEYADIYIHNLEDFNTRAECIEYNANISGEVFATHSAIETLCSDVGISCTIINELDQIVSGYTVLLDEAAYAIHDATLKKDGMLVGCIDTGLSHSEHDGPHGLFGIIENNYKTLFELLRV